MNSYSSSRNEVRPKGQVQAQGSIRLFVGLAGVFLAAMMAGMANRVGALALADVRGALGYGFDAGSWITTAYSTGELIAMPFSAWFAVTLSIRRFELWMIGICAAMAVAQPFTRDIDLLLLLRFVHGIAGGMLIPVLMMAALKHLPTPIRLYGLALYGMTATFAPNLSIWLAGYWIDEVTDWRWVYWQSVPLGAIAGTMIAWGLPKESIQWLRFQQANWLGMVCGVPALSLIVVGLDQGIRLDWFNSPLISVCLTAGPTLLVAYLVCEWQHPHPFIKLQILGRRNLGLGFSVFTLLLVLLLSGSLLPAHYLGAVQEYRPKQMASIGLIVALPQVLLGPLVAMLLYQKRWVDARYVFSFGLFLIALSCFFGTQLTSDWNRDQFVFVQTLQAIGQPLAVVPMLFLATSVVLPQEGPYVSGTINTIRAFGSLLGASTIGQLFINRGQFHAELFLDHATMVSNSVPSTFAPSQLADFIQQQALVLAVSDVYYLLGILALILMPLVLMLTFIPAPVVHDRLPPTSISSSH